jgi:hypothetical protein
MIFQILLLIMRFFRMLENWHWLALKVWIPEVIPILEGPYLVLQPSMT